VSLALQALQKKDLPLIATLASLFLMVKQFEAFNAPRTTKLIHFVKRTKFGLGIWRNTQML
jgi:hypothetical protein